MIWIIKLFLGKKYFIKYTDKLKNDEILIFGHKIYISKEVIKVTNIELKEKVVDIAKNYKTIYGMGTWGWIVTQSAIDRKVKESSWWTSSKVKTISKVIDKGYFMFDCVGLIKGILWGWNGNSKAIYGGAGYKINKVPDVNTEGMLAKCKNISTNFSNIEVGEYLWMNGHCGVYIGDGLAVECTPKWDNKVQITAVGNIGKKSGYNTRTWTKHGKLPYITYVKEEEKVEQYTVIMNKIPVYTNSSNAKKNKNSVGTWSKGTYYVFNKYASMINITKTVGIAGAWINPNDNIVKETPITPPKKEEIPPTENTEKEPDTSEETQPSIDNPTEEETTQETPPNEEIEDNMQEEEQKINIFAQIIKIVIDFIIKLFRK